MEIWKQIIKRITAWNDTTELDVLDTMEIGDENLFCKALDDEYVLFKREYVKEFLFKDGYKVYLVNIEQIEEDAKLDAWADREEKEQIELNDSLNMSLDSKNDKIIRIQEGMDKHDPEDN
tara:strand:+ start:69 stop:428 length:360 start_codon:yes stop_codon:yes gene_type:complete